MMNSDSIIALERIVIGGILRHGMEAVRATGLAQDDFAVPVLGEVFSWLDRHPDKWIAGNMSVCQAELAAAGLTAKLGSPDGAVLELMAAAETTGPTILFEFSGRVIRASINRRLRTVAGRLERGEIEGEGFAANMRELYSRLEALDTGASACRLIQVLDTRRFSQANPPAEPPALFSLGDAKISTPGNLTNIASQAKAGKSAVLGGMLAAAINAEADQRACLGFRASNAGGGAVIHLDTEQSRYDHFWLVKRALHRAGLDAPPSCLRSYCVTDVAIHERREALWREMERAGEIFAVLLDGVADLVLDPNDPEEAFGLVADLHARAIHHDCAFVTILHENPGSESGKTRGHLGSQLERKAETLLRLEKKDEVTTLWAHMARHCSLPKSAGLRFAWDSEAGMHLPVDSANDARSKAAADELTAFAASCFEGHGALSWSKLRDRIMLVGGLKLSGARRKIERMSTEGVIRKNLINEYELAS